MTCFWQDSFLGSMVLELERAVFQVAIIKKKVLLCTYPMGQVAGVVERVYPNAESLRNGRIEGHRNVKLDAGGDAKGGHRVGGVRPDCTRVVHTRRVGNEIGARIIHQLDLTRALEVDHVA